jgi:hypothetical protein
MKKFFYIVIVVAVAGIGFYLGRLSGFVEPRINPSVNDNYPLPPMPPESEPYIPGSEMAGELGKILLLESPVENAKITGSFEISGRVRSDSEKLLVSLSDTEGEELFSRKIDLSANTDDEDDGYTRFDVSVGNLGYLGAATLQLVYFGVESGTEIRQLSFVSSDLIEMNIYLNNSNLDPWQSCEKAFPVRRQVSSDSNIYRSAIEALLAGPIKEETAQGYTTELPGEVKLKSVAADADGVVTADFDRRLERGVAGSCRVGMIRAQIEMTLKQFPEVRGVVISIEGEKEGILQP